MSAGLARHLRLERHLAGLLKHGTWVGSSVIALGVALSLTGAPVPAPAAIPTQIVTAGIALIIVLPVLRVSLMAIVFLRERDFRIGFIALLVLAIIIFGSVLGFRMAGAA